MRFDEDRCVVIVLDYIWQYGLSSFRAGGIKVEINTEGRVPEGRVRVYPSRNEG